MDVQRVDMYIMQNQKFFPPESIVQVREMLLQLPDEKFHLLSSQELKDPTIMLVISLFTGGWGVDRFLLGDTTMGVVKLLTGGCCGVLTIIDWFSVQQKTKELNLNNFLNAYNMLIGAGYGGMGMGMGGMGSPYSGSQF